MSLFNKTRIDVFKPTEDNWCPSDKLTHPFRKGDPDTLVRVSIFPMLDKKTFRVCAWGGDDLGYEKDYDNSDQAMKEFIELIEQDVLNIEDFKGMGFQSA